MAKRSHPGKREALEEYKGLFLAKLEIPGRESYVAYHECRKRLSGPEGTILGINTKTLDRAEYQALEQRKKQLSKAN